MTGSWESRLYQARQDREAEKRRTMHGVCPPKKKWDMRIRLSIRVTRNRMLTLLARRGVGPHKDTRRSARVNERARLKREIP